MKTVLFIKSSITGENSQSTKLALAVIEELKQKEGNIRVIERDLITAPPPHFSSEHLKAFSSSDKELTDELRKLLEWSDQAISELFKADFIVLTAPMYNLAIPSNLKTWIDNINRAGKTFKYSEAGAEGLVRGKKVYIAISTGGVYSELPLKEFDHTESYLRAMLQFLGMKDIKVFRVEGTAMPGVKETALKKAVNEVKLFLS